MRLAIKLKESKPDVKVTLPALISIVGAVKVSLLVAALAPT